MPAESRSTVAVDQLKRTTDGNPKTCNRKCATCNLKCATCSRKCATCNLKCATCSLKCATCNEVWPPSERAAPNPTGPCRTALQPKLRLELLPPASHPPASQGPRSTQWLGAVPVQRWQGRAQSRCRGGRGEPSPGAEVAAVSPVPVQSWQGRAQSRCRVGRGEPSPGAEVAGASPVPVQRWQGRAQSRWRGGSGGPSPGGEVHEKAADREYGTRWFVS